MNRQIKVRLLLGLFTNMTNSVKMGVSAQLRSMVEDAKENTR